MQRLGERNPLAASREKKKGTCGWTGVDGRRKEGKCFHDPSDGGNFISGSSAFSKTRLNIWKFMVHSCIAEAWLGEF